MDEKNTKVLAKLKIAKKKTLVDKVMHNV